MNSSPERRPPSGEVALRGPTVTGVQQAYLQQASGVLVEEAGVIDRLLEDDSDGSRHQRFVVRLADDHTVLVAHNIDLAPRVPLEPGDDVRFFGEFEWNPRGGVVHWTHKDPQRRRPGGWIEHAGQRYE
ncbi:MAG: DUF3465 domain-containing protein [Myxococcales bacterium]|nr:DUF3465 domain-containing protein [Myxococcales bacterium]